MVNSGSYVRGYICTRMFGIAKVYVGQALGKTMKQAKLSKALLTIYLYSVAV